MKISRKTAQKADGLMKITRKSSSKSRRFDEDHAEKQLKKQAVR